MPGSAAAMPGSLPGFEQEMPVPELQGRVQRQQQRHSLHVVSCKKATAVSSSSSRIAGRETDRPPTLIQDCLPNHVICAGRIAGLCKIEI